MTNKKVTRQDLEKWAQSLDANQAPYSSKIQAENHFFVSQLDSRSGGELDEIRNLAQNDFESKQKEAQKWKYISWGSLAAGMGVSIATAGAASLVALAGGFAGMWYSGTRSAKDEVDGSEGEHFVSQLDDVAYSLRQKELNALISKEQSK